MKKLIALVLVLVCVVLLVSCTPTTTDKNKNVIEPPQLIEPPYPRVEGGVEIGVSPTGTTEQNK